MKRSGIYFVIDRRNCRCGITDRLKAAVGLYYIARENGAAFHMVHDAGFDLRDYLEPNETDWSAEKTDLFLDPLRTRRFFYRPYVGPLPTLRSDRKYICRKYSGKNIIEMRGVPDWEAVWRGLFTELFRPTEKVRKAVKDEGLPEHFTAVCVRFINSIGATENATYNAPFPAETQERILRAAMEKTAECAARASSPVIVYSDSVRFLKEAAAAGFRTCDPASVGNIMDPDLAERAVLGNFVNFFAMSQADAVYSVLHLDEEEIPENALYKTQYPRYAAIIGGRPFYRI